MLSKFAAFLMLATFSTTPPKLTSIGTPMSSAFPAKVFVFVIFFVAESALLYQCF